MRFYGPELPTKVSRFWPVFGLKLGSASRTCNLTSRQSVAGLEIYLSFDRLQEFSNLLGAVGLRRSRSEIGEKYPSS
jgi:hypothetical protein